MKKVKVIEEEKMEELFGRKTDQRNGRKCKVLLIGWCF